MKKDGNSLEKLSKIALLGLAKKINLPGRSRMRKSELIEVLSQSGKVLIENNPPKKTNNNKKKSALRSDFGFKVRKKERKVVETFQEEVERGRFDLGVEQESLLDVVSLQENLPRGYGDDKIVLLVRDPHWIYSYWEIQELTIKQALAEHGFSEQYAQKVLRVYLGDETKYQDVEVEGLINNWYLNLGLPNTEIFVDLGIRVQGIFISLVRSNRVRTPRAEMSEVIDDQWMSLEEDYRKLYALSGGFRMGEGSLGLQEMMERRLLQEISSGAISSFFGSGQFRERQRGFWYHLDAELIVYGATEANAKVTLQGRPVQLRPDGTFSARFALPDGEQDIPVTFVSFDEVDHATVRPRVVRNTERT